MVSKDPASQRCGERQPRMQAYQVHHRDYDGNVGNTITFRPPLIVASGQSRLGYSLDSSGELDVVPGPYTFPYESTATFEAIESIEVPAGPFRIFRLGIAVVSASNVIQTYWVARNVGVVRYTDGTTTYELESTSIADVTPDRFWFVPRLGLALNETVYSETVRISGITAAAAISVSGGAYRIDGGGYTSSNGTVTNGQSVTLRLDTAASPGAETIALLTIGGVQAEFSARTAYLDDPFSGDIDGNGSNDALSDGLLIIRYMFGFTGNTLIQDALGIGASRTTAEEIENYLAYGAASLILDVDNNGSVDALSDGLLILRYMFGFRGDTLIQDAVGDGAMRATAAEIEAYIAGFLY